MGHEWEERPQLIKQVAEFRALCETSGRGRLPVTVYGPDPAQAAIGELQAAGVDRVVLTLSQESRAARWRISTRSRRSSIERAALALRPGR